MTIEHHPEEATLAAYAAGALDLGQRVALATHLRACPRCRAWTRAMERVAGAFIADSPPAEMRADALERTLARLDEPPPPAVPIARETADAPPELPDFVRRYAFGPWRFVAPRVRMRPIHLPEPGPTRVFLLKSAPNTKLLDHEHTGLEMTCVLRGAFRHDGGRYGPGDFDLGDLSVRHEPHVEEGEDCVCLVAMQGELRWRGFWGRLAQPFVRF
jgi:putative transcriptional regulator